MGNEVEVIEPQPKARKSKALAAVTPAAMITQAIASGAGVEVMEKLMALHERWEAMQARKAFDDAMAKLRENMPTVVKNQKVDYENKSTDDNGNKQRTNYKYEDLSDVTEALSPVMSGLGLSFRWRTENVQGGVMVTCILTHRDGHSEETSLVGPLDASGKKNPLQAIGSAVTYLQRYTLKAAVGVAAAKDDDAIAAGARDDQRETIDATVNRRVEAEASIRNATTEAALQAAWRAIEAIPEAQLPQADFDALGAQCSARLAEVRATAKGDDFPGDLAAKASLDRQFGAAA